MSAVQVTKTESGWTIVDSNGKSFSVTDKNQNGKWDSSELCKSLSGSGNYLSAEDKVEAQYQILQTGDGATEAEMARYERFKKQQEARAAQQQQITQAQKPAKKNFWQKFATVTTSLMPLFGGLTGMFGALAMNRWSYNSGLGNDSALRFMNASTGILFGMSGALTSAAMISGMNRTPVINTYQGNTGIYSGLSQAIEAQNAYMQELQEQNQIRFEEMQEKQKENAQKAEKQRNTQFVNAMVQEVNNNPDAYNKINAEYIESLEDLDGEREYTEEEIKTAKNIKTSPYIPYTHIGENAEDKTKLSPAFASKLNALIANYEKYNAENSDKKFDYISKANYTAIKTILNKTTLTEADVNKLKEIYKNPVDKED